MSRNSIERGKGWTPSDGDFDEVLKNLEDLHGTEVEFFARGEYPTKQHPKVQHVAKWQNDGTKTIKPAKFIQKTIRRKNAWQTPIFRALSPFIWGSHARKMSKLFEQIGIDFNRDVNRIDTGRLRQSFTYRWLGKLKFR